MSRSTEQRTREYDPAMAASGAEHGSEYLWFGSDDPRCRLDGVRFRSRGGLLRRLPDDPELPEAVRQAQYEENEAAWQAEMNAYRAATGGKPISVGDVLLGIWIDILSIICIRLSQEDI